MMKKMAKIAAGVEKTISRYGLCDAGDTLVLALSGGKDSLLALILLRELGIQVHAVCVDMGYENAWGSRLRSYVSSLGFPVTVVSACARNHSAQSRLGREVQVRMEILGRIGTRPTAAFTPCTHCYSVKAILLETMARKLGATKVVFGHHASDAASSLVKEALMHIDRWDFANPSFSRVRFSRYVLALQQEAECFEVYREEGELLSAIRNLIDIGRVDTDEPPRQSLRSHSSAVEIIRPLFDINEKDIYEVSEELGLKPEPSGCGHGATRVSETPRQVVHNRFVRLAGPRLREWLHGMTKSTIDRMGRGRVRARARRAELLGHKYKPTPYSLEKV